MKTGNLLRDGMADDANPSQGLKRDKMSENSWLLTVIQRAWAGGIRGLPVRLWGQCSGVKEWTDGGLTKE